jgi:hypothetical protein
VMNPCFVSHDTAWPVKRYEGKRAIHCLVAFSLWVQLWPSLCTLYETQIYVVTQCVRTSWNPNLWLILTTVLCERFETYPSSCNNFSVVKHCIVH